MLLLIQRYACLVTHLVAVPREESGNILHMCIDLHAIVSHLCYIKDLVCAITIQLYTGEGMCASLSSIPRQIMASPAQQVLTNSLHAPLPQIAWVWGTDRV